MFPVFLLQVEPHHRVLDMCASPGSKTSQALERVVASGQGARAAGYVVANEIDAKRQGGESRPNISLHEKFRRGILRELRKYF